MTKLVRKVKEITGFEPTTSICISPHEAKAIKKAWVKKGRVRTFYLKITSNA